MHGALCCSTTWQTRGWGPNQLTKVLGLPTVQGHPQTCTCDAFLCRADIRCFRTIFGDANDKVVYLPLVGTLKKGKNERRPRDQHGGVTFHALRSCRQLDRLCCVCQQSQSVCEVLLPPSVAEKRRFLLLRLRRDAVVAERRFGCRFVLCTPTFPLHTPNSLLF
jgi:hypothetical protein